MTRHLFAVALLAALVPIVSLSVSFARGDDDGAGFTPLFDGKSLDGWTVRGGKARYRVEEGAIVGSSVPNSANTFLCTEREYGDFVLEYEFRVDPRLNSGVQIRSESRPDYKNGRVHGYQVEIDPDMERARLWTAGIYDEARRGWLNDLSRNEAARKAFKPKEWNHIRVEAIGDSIKTWLNKVPAADLVDSMTLEGFIALQVHGVGARTEPLEVRWRNLTIKDLGLRAWEPLLGGDSLEGWERLPGGEWKVENGIIIGTSDKSEPRHGQLISKKRFKDFTVRFEFKAVQGNSGFYFRVDKVDGPVGVHGFQAEIDPEKDVGGLYETGGRAWVHQPDPGIVAKHFRKGGWNRMTVSAHGGRIVVHLNDHKMSELRDDPGRKEGHLALQLHGGQDMHVEFRKLEILSEARPRGD